MNPSGQKPNLPRYPRIKCAKFTSTNIVYSCTTDPTSLFSLPISPAITQSRFQSETLPVKILTVPSRPKSSLAHELLQERKRATGVGIQEFIVEEIS